MDTNNYFLLYFMFILSFIFFRNPVCIVKWNFREIGRTKIARSTLAPRWNNASFLVMTPKNQELKDCSLDLEVFDTSADGKNKLTDFLGCIKISGDNLLEFLDQERPRWVECEKAKRFHGEENRHVKGFIEVSGTRKDTALAGAGRGEEEDTVSEMPAKAPVNSRFGAGWFGSSNRSLSSHASNEDSAGAAAGPPSTPPQHPGIAGVGSPGTPSTVGSPPPKSTVASAAAPSLGMLSKAFSIKSPFMRAPSANSITNSVIAEESPSVASNSIVAAAATGPGVTWRDPTPQPGGSASEHTPATADGLFSENSVELPDSALETPPAIPFYLGIISAEGLPSGTEIVCTIKFNGFLVQQLTATSNHDNYMSAQADFFDSPIMLNVPAGLPLATCVLEMHLARRDAHNQNKMTPLSHVELYGTNLVNFVRRGRQSTEMKRILPAQQGGMSATAGMALISLGPGHDSGGVGNAGLKPCKIHLIASPNPIRQEKYELNVLSAKNVAKADLFRSWYA